MPTNGTRLMRELAGSLLGVVGLLAGFGCSEGNEQDQSTPLDEQHRRLSPDAPSAKTATEQDHSVSAAPDPLLQTHEAGSPQCGELQQEVQAAVGDEDDGGYKNHGAYVSAVAHLVSAAGRLGRLLTSVLAALLANLLSASL